MSEQWRENGESPPANHNGPPIRESHIGLISVIGILAVSTGAVELLFDREAFDRFVEETGYSGEAILEKLRELISP